MSKRFLQKLPSQRLFGQKKSLRLRHWFSLISLIVMRSNNHLTFNGSHSALKAVQQRKNVTASWSLDFSLKIYVELKKLKLKILARDPKEIFNFWNFFLQLYIDFCQIFGVLRPEMDSQGSI